LKRNCGIRLFFEVSQFYCRASVWIQASNRREQQLVRFLPTEEHFWIGSPIRKVHRNGFPRVRDMDYRHLAPSLSTPMPHYGFIPRNAYKPRGKAGSELKGGKLSKSLQTCLLNDIVSFVRVPHQSSYNVQNELSITNYE
jgi:hypothetical protein